jgi:hypothetical protein
MDPRKEEVMRAKSPLPTHEPGVEVQSTPLGHHPCPPNGARERAVLLFLTVVAVTAPSGARAQEPEGSLRFTHAAEVRRGPGYMVLADRRIFATMSFLNSVGYDREQEGQEMHPLRIRVRQELAGRLASHPEDLEKWKHYYEQLGYPVWVFVEFSLMLSPDYPFQQVYPASHSQYEEAAENLSGFPEVLNAFWEVADLEGLWQEIRPDYQAEIDRYDFDEMSRQMDTLWEYLRMQRQDDYLLVNVPNLLDARFTGIGAQFGPYYYQVESAGASSYALNMHEYLHSVVNPLVEQHFAGSRSKLTRYYEAGKSGRYAQSYQSPLAMTYESLTRALDYRLRVRLSDEPGAGDFAEARIVQITAGGLTPTGPFYHLLSDRYENAESSFNRYVPTLLEELPPYEESDPGTSSSGRP